MAPRDMMCGSGFGLGSFAGSCAPLALESREDFFAPIAGLKAFPPPAGRIINEPIHISITEDDDDVFELPPALEEEKAYQRDALLRWGFTNDDLQQDAAGWVSLRPDALGDLANDEDFIEFCSWALPTAPLTPACAPSPLKKQVIAKRPAANTNTAAVPRRTRSQTRAATTEPIAARTRSKTTKATLSKAR